jgi:pimeloyl-ACP methyl ester carboxylesterase
MGKTFQYLGNDLAFTQFGQREGYPILVQHGMIASIRDGELFTSLVSSGSCVISIARPGYGRSSPYQMSNIAEWGEIVSVLIDQLGIQQFDVLGISSGAPYSYSIGCFMQDKVRRIYILSGTPALYDPSIREMWPYPDNREASLRELQQIAKDVFFSHGSEEQHLSSDIQDSLANECFGIALDLKLRCLDWGFKLPDVKQTVIMQHSKADTQVPFIAAEMTAKQLPNCRMIVRESDNHFSKEILDKFIKEVVKYPEEQI